MLVALFIGNLAADAVLQKGNSENFLSFRAASSRKYKDPKTGQNVEFTQWVTVNINRNYEGVAPYLTKGAKVFVEGQFATRLYQDRAGMTQVGLTINASRIELCGAPSQTQLAQTQQQQPMRQQPMQQQQMQQQQMQQQSMQMQQRSFSPETYHVPPSETDMYNNEPF